jgi:tetratricopeptide (TPR) repeat protein
MPGDQTAAVPAPRGPRPWLLLLVVLVSVAAIYVDSLTGPFVWDDHLLVEEAAAVRSAQRLSAYFTAPFWVENEQSADVRAYYRPIVTLSYALDFRVHGDNPAGYHVTNLLIHLVNTGLLFALARRMAQSATVAALVAASWALLPRLAEAVAWISGRTDALAALFLLAGLLAWLDGRTAWRRAAALLLLLGLLSKEVALAGLIGILAYELRSAGRRRDAFVTALSVGGCYAALRILALRGHRNELDDAALSVPNRLAASLEAVGRYPLMVLDAWRPRTQVGQLEVPSLAYVALGALLLAVVVWRVPHALRRLDRWDALWATVGIGAIALVLHVIPIPVNVVAADRFLYVPLAALGMMAARRLDRLRERRRWVVPAAIAVTASLGVVTLGRVKDWCDEVALWVNAVRTTPETNTLPREQLAGLFFRSGMHQSALAHYRRASRMQAAVGRVKPLTLVGMADSLAFLGDYERSMALISDVVQERPDVPKYRYACGLAHLRLLQFGSARTELEEALRLYPAYDRPRQVLATLPQVERDATQLLAPDGLAGRADPVALARVLSRLGRAAEATQIWLAILGRPMTGAEVAQEAAEFTVRFAPPDAAQKAYELYAERVHGRTDAQLVAAFRARMALVARLSAIAPAS